mmetsp:Transcript_117027/g.331579  ORF Transcript_117027/g.331579 Transcript_117027/m.331579 type:complete len:228 (+) Transcript_117027:728-1411(+)
MLASSIPVYPFSDESMTRFPPASELSIAITCARETSRTSTTGPQNLQPSAFIVPSSMALMKASDSPPALLPSMGPIMKAGQIVTRDMSSDPDTNSQAFSSAKCFESSLFQVSSLNTFSLSALAASAIQLLGGPMASMHDVSTTRAMPAFLAACKTASVPSTVDAAWTTYLHPSMAFSRASPPSASRRARSGKARFSMPTSGLSSSEPTVPRTLYDLSTSRRTMLIWR